MYVERHVVAMLPDSNDGRHRSQLCSASGLDTRCDDIKAE
jgi:hypothetical protein